MFIVFGTKTKLKVTDPVGVRALCPSCAVESQFVELQVVDYFSLYWIALFPIRHGVKFVECQYCHAQLELTLEQLRERAAAAAREQAAAEVIVALLTPEGEPRPQGR